MRNSKNHARRLSAVITGALALGMLALAGPASANHPGGSHVPVSVERTVIVPSIKPNVCMDHDDDPRTPDQCNVVATPSATLIVKAEASGKLAAPPQVTPSACPAGEVGQRLKISALGTGIDYLRVSVYRKQNGGTPQPVVPPVSQGQVLGSRQTLNLSICAGAGLSGDPNS